MKTLTRADFPELKNKLGRVAMEFIKDRAPYSKGTIAGFTPEVAFEYYDQGFAVPHGKKGVAVPTPVVVAAGGAKPVTSKSVQTPDEPIAIPDDWAKKGLHARRIQLAAKISGKPAKEVGGDAGAIEIIKEELSKRGAANPPAEPPANPPAAPDQSQNENPDS